MPAEFSDCDWEKYEESAMTMAVGWLRGREEPLFVDVGCQIGIYSLAALFASPTATCIAIDSDLNSLSAAQRMCRFANAEHRLKVVWGFVTDTPGCPEQTLDDAIALTAEAIAVRGIDGDPRSTRFVCLQTDGDDQSIPRWTIDQLFGESSRRPMLLKCDVEGAEKLVVKGMASTLERFRPDLLLSIHPPALPLFDSSADDMRRMLERSGYDPITISVDHEEHWWCAPAH